MSAAPDAKALQADLERLALQEQRLQLPTMDADRAWALGAALRERALARGAAVTIEIRLNGEPVFFHAMRGTAPANADWARRKRNTSELLDQSSYRVGRELLRDATTLEARMGLPTRDYAAHGGSVPLRVQGQRVGTVTVSGLPQRADHALIVEVLAEVAGIALAEIALA